MLNMASGEETHCARLVKRRYQVQVVWYYCYIVLVVASGVTLTKLHARHQPAENST